MTIFIDQHLLFNSHLSHYHLMDLKINGDNLIQISNLTDSSHPLIMNRKNLKHKIEFKIAIHHQSLNNALEFSLKETQRIVNYKPNLIFNFHDHSTLPIILEGASLHSLKSEVIGLSSVHHYSFLGTHIQ